MILESLEADQSEKIARLRLVSGRSRLSRLACGFTISSGSMTLASVVRHGSSVGFLKRHADNAQRSRPRACRHQLTCPAVAGQSPVTTFIRVDLPHPDGPTTATNSPGSTWSVVRCRARVPFVILAVAQRDAIEIDQVSHPLSPLPIEHLPKRSQASDVVVAVNGKAGINPLAYNTSVDHGVHPLDVIDGLGHMQIDREAAQGIGFILGNPGERP